MLDNRNSKINKNINGSIITDKARFSNDSTKNERIYHIFEKKNNKYEKFIELEFESINELQYKLNNNIIIKAMQIENNIEQKLL